MRPLVVDASAMVEYLLGTARGVEARAVFEARDVDLQTPALCDVEVASALRGLLARKAIPWQRALQVVEDYADLPLTRHFHVALLPRVLNLRKNLTAYDATYLVLAEALDAALVTCDAPLARAAEAHVPELRVVLLG